MSSSRLRIILVCALVGACLGTVSQALLINGRTKEFRSLAKLVAGWQMVMQQDDETGPLRQDFYGTIIETIESSEMKRRALERVRALNPEFKDKECDVEIRVAQTKGSAIFNILATGSEPKYTRIFLDALLDEFISFRQSIREQAQSRVVHEFFQDVFTRQKSMEDAAEKLEKARVLGVDTLSVRSDLERLVVRLNIQRNQRDDLRFKIKLIKDDEAARAPLQTQLEAIESEINDIEKGLARRELDLAELKTFQEKHDTNKLVYEKLFKEVEKLQAVFNTVPDYVAIQERATPASENVEDWVLPVAVGAVGGGFLAGLVGFALSFLILRSPKPPQIPTAVV
jgi:hypothetical protein